MEPCDSCLSNEDGLCMAYNARCEDALSICFEYHRECIRRLNRMLDVAYGALEFYADKDRWFQHWCSDCEGYYWTIDEAEIRRFGEWETAKPWGRAAKALAKIGGKKDEKDTN